MPLILRAIITGFGYKIGTEVARYFVDRVADYRKAKQAAPDAEGDLPDGLPSDPDNPGNEPPRPPAVPIPERD
ncbi:MAG: hypothetical protein IAG13_28670 [Deltaproteobacteria bacterium]|nr:hypothetical protein [Nannocystaceae bacterium]